jgi:hypothetical protein
MKQQVPRAALLLLSVAVIVWLGAVNVRAMIGYELFHTGTLEFISTLDPAVEREVMHLVSYASLVVDGGYIVVLLSAVLFLWSTPLVLKEQGWLMMSAVLLFVFMPVEFYTIYLDAKFIMMEIFGNPAVEELRTIFLKRFTALSGLPVIALLCYYTVIPLIVWKPFTKKVLHDR